MDKISSLFSLEGKTAIVTGASGGLGERITRILHTAGATVVVGARRLPALQKLADELGERIIPVACDVCVEEDCQNLIEVALKTGSIDVLVNNAGVTHVGPAEDEPVSTFDWVIDVNLKSVFVLAQLAAKQMIKQGSGSIINISSALGLASCYPMQQASYCASKGAVVNLTRELGAQWAAKGVRVNSIAPGCFDTDMTDGLLGSEQGRKFVKRQCPLGRPGTSDELDGAVLFLASDASSYVIGQILAVDGGWSIH